LPQEKQSMMARLPGLSGLSTLGRRGPSAAWGLDLSEYGLKAVKLYRDPKPPKGQVAELQIEACLHIPHSKPLTFPEAEMQRGEIIEATLKEFLSRAGDLKGCKFAINVPSHRVLGRFFELPALAAKKVPEAIAFEARHQLPITLEQLSWTHHTLDPYDAKLADDQPRKIMVVAARDAHVKDRVATFKAAGIQADHVQSDCVALHNALVHEFFTGEEESKREDAILALDVGSESASITISSPRCVWFRTFGLGGDQVSNALIRELNLTHEQAEKLKREPARARRFGQMQEAVHTYFEQMASEIERSIASYEKLYPDHPVQQVYGLGGAFQTYGLLRHLRTGK
jgi:type IV pilus assembly protein PilM